MNTKTEVSTFKLTVHDNLTVPDCMALWIWHSLKAWQGIMSLTEPSDHNQMTVSDRVTVPDTCDMTITDNMTVPDACGLTIRDKITLSDSVTGYLSLTEPTTRLHAVTVWQFLALVTWHSVTPWQFLTLVIWHSVTTWQILALATWQSLSVSARITFTDSLTVYYVTYRAHNKMTVSDNMTVLDSQC